MAICAAGAKRSVARPGAVCIGIPAHQTHPRLASIFRRYSLGVFPVSFEKGTHTLRIEKTEDDVGFAELDAIDQIPCALTGGVPEQDTEE